MLSALTGNSYGFVVESIVRHGPHDDPRKDIVTVRGRRGGILHFLLSLIGIQTRCALHVTKLEIRIVFESKLGGVSESHSILMQQKPSIGTQFTRLGLLGYIGLLWTAVALMYGITQASTTIMLVSIPGIFAFLISFITQRSFALALYGHSTIIIWFQGALLRSESFGQSKIEDVANIIRDVILETEYAVAKSDRVPEMLAPEYQPPPQRVPVYLPEREAPAWQPPPPTARDSTANPTWYGGGMPERTTSQSPTVEDLVDAMKEFSRMAPPRPLYKKFMGHLSNHFRDRDPTFFKKILDVYNIHKVKLPATGDLRADQIVAASRVCDLIVKFDSPASNPKALGNLAETLRSLIR